MDNTLWSKHLTLTSELMNFDMDMSGVGESYF